MPAPVRPKRRAIPIAIKRQVCARQDGHCTCGCGLAVSEKPKTGTKFDHRPPLRLRNISADGLDYEPHQHSPAHIDALCREAHDRRTFGTGATTAGTDTGLIKKERKRSKPPKFKQRIQNRPFPPKGTVKFPRRKP